MQKKLKKVTKKNESTVNKKLFGQNRLSSSNDEVPYVRPMMMTQLMRNSFFFCQKKKYIKIIIEVKHGLSVLYLRDGLMIYVQVLVVKHLHVIFVEMFLNNNICFFFI